jgi:hypothetical protein
MPDDAIERGRDRLLTCGPTQDHVAINGGWQP